MSSMQRNLKQTISNSTGMIINSQKPSTVDSLPKQFVLAMRTLFDIMDDKKTGFVRLVDIENRWQDDGSQALPRGVTEALRKVTPPNGMLTFERFCAGLKISLLRNQVDDKIISSRRLSESAKKEERPPSAPLLDIEIKSHQWNNTATVRPNNAMPVQRALSLPQLTPDSDSDLIIEPIPVIPGLGPPKPPRTAAGLAASNNSGNGGLDKAEIRNALQNWQRGVLMNDFNRGTADGQTTDTQQNGIFQKKSNIRRREPRRHTLQNGIDYNMLKRLKHLEQEKDVLIQGLNSVEKTRDWYLKQIAIVQDKMKHLGRMGSNMEQWSESHQERLDLQRARVVEVNRHLHALSESWERGGFPIHMNLAVRQPGVQYSYSNDIVNRLKQQNRQLTEEVSQKSERITALEREKGSLLRDVVKLQRGRGLSNEEVVF